MNRSKLLLNGEVIADDIEDNIWAIFDKLITTNPRNRCGLSLLATDTTILFDRNGLATMQL
jgi:hypothetical protein